MSANHHNHSSATADEQVDTETPCVAEGPPADGGGRIGKQADILIELASSAELFHAPDGTGYADVIVAGHRETWPIRAKGFRRWLVRLFYLETGKAPNAQALQSALNVIEAKAQYDGLQHAIHVRVGGLDGRIYVDLADEHWRAVEIDATGWQVIERPPVRFRRSAGMLPLPLPVRGGSIGALRSSLNLQSDADFVLVVAWLLAALREHGPYPVLVLTGEQGSAKSTLSAILRSLVDPNSADVRSLPRNEHELFIGAYNGLVLAFDNVSGLRPWLSDAICRLSTGGAFVVRQLYTDHDEVLFEASRPVILNGIEDMVARPDLADRSLFVTLEPIPEEARRSEAELWANFEAQRPGILGALLDALVCGLKNLPATRLNYLPRMADLALWLAACEPALWPKGTFEFVYAQNRDEVVEDVIDADPIAAAVRDMMASRVNWSGTATELFAVLSEEAGESVTNSKDWPKTPRGLSGHLRRAATFLRKIGIEIDRDRVGHARTRTIRITKNEISASADPNPEPSASSAEGLGDTSATQTAAHSGHLRAQSGVGSADGLADGDDQVSTGSVRTNPPENGAAAPADGADANTQREPASSAARPWRRIIAL